MGAGGLVRSDARSERANVLFGIWMAVCMLASFGVSLEPCRWKIPAMYAHNLIDAVCGGYVG